MKITPQFLKIEFKFLPPCFSYFACLLLQLELLAVIGYAVGKPLLLRPFAAWIYVLATDVSMLQLFVSLGPIFSRFLLLGQEDLS